MITRRLSAAITLVAVLAACGEGGEAGADVPSTSDGASASAAAASEDTTPEPTFPEGWEIRTDDGTTSSDAVSFTAVGETLRVRPGPRAIYYDPGMTATGRYRISATFRQMEEPTHAEAYGLFVGGRSLQGPGQDYLYFLIRKDGKYLIKHRAAEETHTLVDWTDHEAIRAAGSDGSMTNTLAVESGPTAVRFLVNGTRVNELKRVPMLRTDGIAGLRVNHDLDVRVTDLSLESLSSNSTGS